ncbi:hypothetical protein GCM10010350_68350 [Streptomyces galilaeus]|nr:hypothetical protein GCM10010350_68350 [Streptomyces galilaeus]
MTAVTASIPRKTGLIRRSLWRERAVVISGCSWGAVSEPGVRLPDRTGRKGKTSRGRSSVPGNAGQSVQGSTARHAAPSEPL